MHLEQSQKRMEPNKQDLERRLHILSDYFPVKTDDVDLTDEYRSAVA